MMNDNPLYDAEADYRADAELERRERKKLKRYPKKVLKKYYAEQLRLEPVVSQSEPHKVIRCVACDEAKHLEFHRDGDNQMYYVCHHCGFESQPIGPAPYYLK